MKIWAPAGDKRLRDGMFRSQILATKEQTMRLFKATFLSLNTAQVVGGIMIAGAGKFVGGYIIGAIADAWDKRKSDDK